MFIVSSHFEWCTPEECDVSHSQRIGMTEWPYFSGGHMALRWSARHTQLGISLLWSENLADVLQTAL
jgi:hypothetical protein